MDDIWQQFHRLPKQLRDAVATAPALASIDRLEKQHPGLDLADIVMRLMVKNVAWSSLLQTLETEAALDPGAAADVVHGLQTDVLGPVADYLQMPKPVPPAPRQAVEPSGATIPVPPPANLPIVPPETPFASPKPVVQPEPPTQASPVPAAVPAMSAFALKPLAPTNAPAPSMAPEDDVEIDQQASRLKMMTGSQMMTDLDALAQHIIDQHHLVFPGEMLNKRALAIIKSRLKEIRTADMTRDMLTRSSKVGGLELDDDLAMNVAASIEAAVKQLNATGHRQAPVPAPPVPPAMPPRPRPVPPPVMVTPTPVVPAQPITPPTPPPAPMPAVPSVAIPVAIIPQTPAPQPPVSVAPPAPVSVPKPQSMPIPVAIAPVASPNMAMPSMTGVPVNIQRQPDRPSMADITPPQKTAMGPIEEMASLTLNQFRRLGQGATDSTKHLLHTFDQLKKESYGLWLDAIAGWRKSELYELYLTMGRQSLDEGISVTDVVKKRAAASQAYLSEHEFTSIADLNRHLQF